MEKGTENSWEIDGDCFKCRRNDYCSKPCRLNKLASQAATYRAFHNAFRKTKVGMAMELLRSQMKEEVK